MPNGLRFVFDPDAVVMRDASETFETWLANAERAGRVIVARDHGQSWLMWSIASEFQDRHWVPRRLIRLAIARRRVRMAPPAATRLLTSVPRGQTLPTLTLAHDLAYYGALADEFGDTQLHDAFDRVSCTPD